MKVVESTVTCCDLSNPEDNAGDVAEKLGTVVWGISKQNCCYHNKQVWLLHIRNLN